MPSSSSPLARTLLTRAAPGLLYASALPANPGNVLGVIGFGGATPDNLPAACPFIAAPLRPAAGGAAYEIWRAASPVTYRRLGPVQGAISAELAFGCLRLDDALPVEDAVEQAYLAIFDFLAPTGLTQPIRFWNYLNGILDDDAGLERYRRVNIGRHRAFLARLRQPVPPAASGVGGHAGASIIYFLAAAEPAQAVENPRQISAYQYPPQYGPRSPSFSRAALHGEALFISGTASIVGHETRHQGDAAAQLDETCANLRALIANAGLQNALEQPAHWALKIYLGDPRLQTMAEPVLAKLFGAASQRLYLTGQVCRADLLLEIEAYYAGG